MATTRQMGKSLENETLSEWTRLRPAQNENWRLTFREEAVNAWLATRLPQWIRNRTTAGAGGAGSGVGAEPPYGPPAEGAGTMDSVFPFRPRVDDDQQGNAGDGRERGPDDALSDAAAAPVAAGVALPSARPEPIAFSALLPASGLAVAGPTESAEPHATSDANAGPPAADDAGGSTGADGAHARAEVVDGPLANLGFGEAQVEMLENGIRFGVRLVAMTPPPASLAPATATATGGTDATEADPDADGSEASDSGPPDASASDSGATSAASHEQSAESAAHADSLSTSDGSGPAPAATPDDLDGNPSSEDAAAAAAASPMPTSDDHHASGQVVSFLVTPRFDPMTGRLGVELSQFAIGRLQLPLESFVRGLARRMMLDTGVTAAEVGSSLATVEPSDVAPVADEVGTVGSDAAGEAGLLPTSRMSTEQNTRTIASVLALLAGETIEPVFPIDRHRQARIVGIRLERGMFEVELQTQPRGTGLPRAPGLDVVAPASTLTERTDRVPSRGG